MLYRLRKIAASAAYLTLIWLTWQWFQGDLEFTFAIGCIVVSSLWLGLTYMELGHLFRTYFDVFSRLKMLVPIGLGVALAGLAFWAAGTLALQIAAGTLLFFWLLLYAAYVRNKAKYRKQGHGPLPKGAWVNPPADAIGNMDLILTSGNMANRLRESVGHGEVGVQMEDGDIYLFSTYMEKGAVLNKTKRVAEALRKRGHYIILRPTRPFDEEQLAAIPLIVRIMLAQNDRWRTETQEKRSRLIMKLWLPRKLKLFLIRKLPVTGYDWLGLLIGQRHQDRWTCIGSVLELYHRLGMRTNHYGTGLLGLGTGLLDPIMPVRFLSDPAFRLLTEEDRISYEQAKQPA